MDTIKAYDGVFRTDTDLKMPTSTADKVTAIAEMEARKTDLFYGKQWSTIDEIKLDIEALSYQASLLDVEELYTKAKLTRKAKAILESRQPQEPQQQGSASAQPGGQAAAGIGQQANQDVAKELSPNKLLAEAGI